MKHFAWNDLRDIVTVQGRTWEHEDNLYFNWSSSGFTVRFRGSALLAEFLLKAVKNMMGFLATQIHRIELSGRGFLFSWMTMINLAVLSNSRTNQQSILSIPVQTSKSILSVS